MLHRFSRTEMLIGSEGLGLLKKSRVAVFGVGGVGSFAAEALARSGVGEMVLIDHDCICITNINRQIHATTGVVGRPKVEVMRDRIIDINPAVRVVALQRQYSAQNAQYLLNKGYDYVVDAIDMVSSKVDLVVRCKSMDIKIISSMGAGNKLDPSLFRVADIYDTSVCPLARIMRRELRNRRVKSLKVVYSTEVPVKQKLKQSSRVEKENRTPGSIAFVPSVAGLLIAGEVIRDLIGYGGKE